MSANAVLANRGRANRLNKPDRPNKANRPDKPDKANRPSRGYVGAREGLPRPNSTDNELGFIVLGGGSATPSLA